MSLALWLSVVFGLMFQFPLITYSLLQADIVAYNTMKSKRYYIFVGILLVSGILTPPDIVSQLLLTAPTYLLFEIGLFFGKKRNKLINSFGFFLIFFKQFQAIRPIQFRHIQYRFVAAFSLYKTINKIVSETNMFGIFGTAAEIYFFDIRPDNG